MDEHEPEEQFEATEYDEKSNIIPPAPAIATKKPKRMTVADLKKEIDRIDDKIDDDALTWIGEIDARLDDLEGKAVENLPSFVPDIAARLDNHDAAIGALADALRSHIEEPAATPPEPAAEIEFAQPPQQTPDSQARAGDVGSLRQTYPPVQSAGGQIHKSDIEAMASMCQHMTDVLLICRLLKVEQRIPDEDRTYLLTIACRAAGVPLSSGLQIRAGVKFAGA